MIARSTGAVVGQIGVQFQPLVDVFREAVLAEVASHADEPLGVCHTFSNSSATVKLANVYMQSVTFVHREIRSQHRLSRMLNSRERWVQQPYEGVRVSDAAYAGKDNIDSFGVCS
jgi:hypothetical protein